MLHATMFLGYVCNMLGTYFHLLVGIGALESFGTREWCFRGIYMYKGDLWENDLHVSARQFPGAEAIRTTVVPIIIFIRTTVVPIRILIRTTGM